jgi:hypothetical protein
MSWPTKSDIESLSESITAFYASVQKWAELSEKNLNHPWDQEVKNLLDQQYLDVYEKAVALNLPRPQQGDDMRLWMMEAEGALRARISDIQASLKPTEESTGDENPSVDYSDFRDGPDGELLTASYCRERFGVTGKELGRDPLAKKTRQKHPEGRKGGDFIYRCDAVSLIANRKADNRK